jgi:hypothetical protein
MIPRQRGEPADSNWSLYSPYRGPSDRMFSPGLYALVEEHWHLTAQGWGRGPANAFRQPLIVNREVGER